MARKTIFNQKRMSTAYVHDTLSVCAPPPLMDKRENRQREPERVVAHIAESAKECTKRALAEREALFLDHFDVWSKG